MKSRTGTPGWSSPKKQEKTTTIIADLTQAESIPSGAFDCFIFTQTLQFIYDTRAAVATTYRTLKPQGVLLASFPVLSQISRYDMAAGAITGVSQMPPSNVCWPSFSTRITRSSSPLLFSLP